MYPAAEDTKDKLFIRKRYINISGKEQEAMSEETRMILEKLESLDVGMKELRGDVQELRSDTEVLKSDVEKIKCDMALLKIIADRCTYPMKKIDELLELQKDKGQIELDISNLKLDMYRLSLKAGLV